MTTATLEHALLILNQAVAADPAAMTALVRARVPCNDRLGQHSTIQCGKEPTVGLLGILNGIFGIREDGYGYITAILDDRSDDVVGFVATSR